MNDYISRQKAIEIINHYAEMALYRMLSLEPGSRACLIAELQYGDRKHIRKMVEDIPAADVRPVAYGEWASLGGDEWCCTNCGHVISTEGSWERPCKKYCEECGADMRGKSNE